MCVYATKKNSETHLSFYLALLSIEPLDMIDIDFVSSQCWCHIIKIV